MGAWFSVRHRAARRRRHAVRDRPLNMAEETPFQTVGPFFDFALPFAGGDTLIEPNTVGERITIHGRVVDGAGDPVPDALVEIWQADANGRYHHPTDARAIPIDPAFDGFGR